MPVADARRTSPKRPFAEISGAEDLHSPPRACRKNAATNHDDSSFPKSTGAIPQSICGSTVQYPVEPIGTAYESESSELSESSDEPSSDSDMSDSDESEHGLDLPSQKEGEQIDTEEVVNVVPLNKRKSKPRMRLHSPERQPGTTLRDRLQGFLPQMAAANNVLEKEREEGLLVQRNIELVDENEDCGYIEMDLGLGVLEEKREDTVNGSSEEEEEEEDHSDGQETNNSREKDVLGKLLRQERPDHVGIQVIAAGDDPP